MHLQTNYNMSEEEHLQANYNMSEGTFPNPIPYWVPFIGKPADNFCAEGKLLPKLYLLGAPKCASTSLSEDLIRGARKAGSTFDPAPHQGSQKEWHFWSK